MGKVDNETRRNEDLTDMLELVLSEWRKGLYTAVPGVIESYDPAAKRASILPALRTELRTGDSLAESVLPNVPVIFPSGGGWCLAVNKMDRGEAVLVIFCQRGIGAFKKTFGVEDPSGGVLQKDAAVAIAGFGALSIGAPNGISLQNDGGSVKADLSDAGLVIDINGNGATFNPDGSVSFTNGANITAGGDFVTASGISLDNHVHPILSGSSAPGPTGAPQ